MRNLLFLFSFISICNVTNAKLLGEEKADSLIRLIPKAKKDTNHVNLLWLTAKTYDEVDNDKAIEFAKQSLHLVKTLKWPLGIAKSYILLGNIYSKRSETDKYMYFYSEAIKIFNELKSPKDIAKVNMQIGTAYKQAEIFPKSIEYYKKALQIWLALKNDKMIGEINNNIGFAYFYISDYTNAIEYLNKSIQYALLSKDKLTEAHALCNLAAVYSELGEFPKGLENFQKSLKIAEEIKDTNTILSALGNIGIVYNEQHDHKQALAFYNKALALGYIKKDIDCIATNLGNIGDEYSELNNFKLALEYAFKSLEYYKKINSDYGIAGQLNNIGDIYEQLQDYESAMKYAKDALKINKELGNRNWESINYSLMSNIYYSRSLENNEERKIFLKGKTKSQILMLAKTYVDSALNIGNELGDLNLLIENYKLKSEILNEQGDYKNSLENYRLYYQFRDSVFNVENGRKLTRMSMQYEFDKKEASVKAAQEKKDIFQRNIRNSIGAGLIISVFFLAIVYRQRNKISFEKKRSEELLLNILPEEVAQELKEKGSAEAQLIDHVTVLFTDFKGFTQLSEKLSPKELVAEINECFSAFDLIMEKYGVEKIKTIGDAYMAAGGLPTANNTHPQDVIYSALEIQKFMNKHKLDKEKEGKLYFEIRIGIHTGPVVAGIVGVKKFQYDIWGDTVNTASRMESSGEVGKVNISGPTYELVKDSFKCLHRGKIEAKNKGEIDMYFVESI